MFANLMLSVVLAGPPVITIDRDNIDITQSCIIDVTADSIIDADNNGVIHIIAPNIHVEFLNEQLHGAATDQLPDSFNGTGIKITAKNVTLQNANVSGYKVGIHAIDAGGLTIHHCDVSDNFRQRLKSTPKAEDASDWLWPHANDNNEWITNYGAGLCIEDSDYATISNIKTRRGQNGIILDRVNDSKIYDCDCSFLSGWGLAMWRSNRNIISRNAFDFCVRGYSHGIYNRGQDSAGILMFEQCCENVIAENSATHCGDGLFAFAGKEALGEINPRDDLKWYKQRGCYENKFVENDFSDSVAHGLELTFSSHNYIFRNRFHRNAICGIWGGYSEFLFIVDNEFSANGDMAYGKERGAINIEHGEFNHVISNRFSANACGVHFWWDRDEHIFALPWHKANRNASPLVGLILFNSFHNDRIGLQLALQAGAELHLGRNIFEGVQQDLSTTGEGLIKTYGADVIDPVDQKRIGAELEEWIEDVPQLVNGSSKPVDTRTNLAGREHIIMTEWGPYDWQSPLLLFVERFDHSDRYRLLGVTNMPEPPQIKFTGDVFVDVRDDRVIVSPRAIDELIPYSISGEVDGQSVSAKGLLTGGTWTVRTITSPVDPREDAERWKRESKELHLLTCDPLHFPFGSGGMTQARALPVPLPQDHFGTIATRTLTFPTGKWRIKTTSDDGIRVWLDDKLVIDDWSWHPPKEHIYEFEVAQPRTIKMRVEHFELDGYAILTLDIEQAE